MTDIVNESKETNLKNITRIRKYQIKIVDGKKLWYKKCPKCGAEQQYSTLRAISHATRKNKHCLSCKNSSSGNPFFKKHHTKEHKEKLSKIQLETCSYRYKKVGKNPDKIKKKCKGCGFVFNVVTSQNNRKYCSYSCAINDNFGFDPSKKTKPEKEFERILQKFSVEYKSPYPLKGKLYDFYIPHKNTLVEIDGIYWHGKNLPDDKLNATQTRNRINDDIKTCIAIKNGYTLKRIWEDEIEESACIKIFL
jgi:very-short-patch-repair endonuclease